MRLSHRFALPVVLNSVLLLFVLGACGDDDVFDGGIDARVPDASIDAPMDGALDVADIADAATDALSDAVSPDAPDAGNDGLCPAELVYRASTGTPTVHAAGEWNAFSQTEDEMIGDGAGDYRVTLSLPPGLHGYKLYVEGDGGDDPWRFDPDNGYRVYVDGIENSGLRVRDCFVPQVDLESWSPTADGAMGQARMDMGRAGPATWNAELRNQGVSRALTSDEFSVDGDVATIDLSGLSNGKYTVELSGRNGAGETGEILRLPFWVEDTPFDWADALLYVVMPDRFRNGDVSNDPDPTDASPGADFLGGDLVGMRQAIEEGYLDDLAVNAIWLTPWMVNPSGSYLAGDEVNRVTGYHGYWPIDPLGVDERFGGEEALSELVDAAHARGIRVLMDLVVNHVHEDHPYVDDHPEWFSDGCVCGTAGCDWTDRRLDCLFRPYMPDINWTNKGAQEQLLEDAMVWMARYDLDGFRVDAVKHVQDHAVTNLRIRVREAFEQGGTHHFLMGETAMGWDAGAGPDGGGNIENYETIRRYVGPDALDGQFDFVLYYSSALQFLRDDVIGRGMAHVDFWTRASLDQFPAPALMTPYIGSHDTPRFVSLASDPGRANNQWGDYPGDPDALSMDRMYLAFAWMFALPGVPLLYYGDEYGQAGGADPDNRRMMRFGDELTSMEQTQLDRVSGLTQARAAAPGLRSRELRTLFVDEDKWIFVRGSGDEQVVVALVRRNFGSGSIDIDIPADVFAEGTELRDLLSPQSATVSGNSVRFNIDDRNALYLVGD